MGFSLPSGVVNTNSAYLYAGTSLGFGTLVKELSDQVLVILDYSDVTPAITITSYTFTVDVSSNPALVLSYPQIDALGDWLTFLITGGIVGQQYNITIEINGERSDILTINIPSTSDSCSIVRPVPALYSQSPLGTQGYVNTGVRYFWGAAPPANPTVLDQWFDPTTNTLSEWTTDGTKYFWSTLTSDGLVTEAPLNTTYYSRFNGNWIADPIQSDAPANSKIYSRYNNIWVQDPIQSDATIDSQTYGRNNGGWVVLSPPAVSSDAPVDGILYGRLNAAWVQVPTYPITVDAPNDTLAYVRSGGTWVSGGTFNSSIATQGNLSANGSLLINGNAQITGVTTFGAQVALAVDPISNLQAATKQYVDNTVGRALISGSAIFVQLSGSIMTGPLTLSAAPLTNMQAANKQYVDDSISSAVEAAPYLPLVGGTLTGPLVLAADPTVAAQAATKKYVDDNSAGGIGDAPYNTNVYGRSSGAWVQALAITGGTLTGVLILSADPVNTLDAATKQYVDNSINNGLAGSGFLPLSGGTMTGPLLLAADPTVNLGTSTKQYVDNKGATIAPLMNGTAAAGVNTTYSRSDHTHPSDTSRYPISNPAGYQTSAQVTASLASYLPLVGGTLSGALVLNADPTVNLGAVTKQYVDSNLTTPTNTTIDMGTF
jgi:hypothetical protein